MAHLFNFAKPLLCTLGLGLSLEYAMDQALLFSSAARADAKGWTSKVQDASSGTAKSYRRLKGPKPSKLGGDRGHGDGWDTSVEVTAAGRDKETVADRFEAFVDHLVSRRAPSRTPIVFRASVTRKKLRRAWWRSRARATVLGGRRATKSGLQAVVSSALKHSHQIAVFGRIPAIRETGVTEAHGRYRPEVFLEAKKDRRNDPANSFAEAAGFPRAKYTERAVEGGIRSRVISGAEIVLSHRKSDFDTNLTEYDPKDQQRDKTVVTVVQPLLRDGGIRHGRRIIRVAELDSEVAMQEFIRQAEQHLLEIVRAYWNIYRARAIFLQRYRLAKSATLVIRRLQERTDIDADPVHISRARASASRRRTDLLRARTAIKNAELRLISLVNDPRFDRVRAGELIPADVPPHRGIRFNRRQLLRKALIDRPELRQAFMQFRAALVREGISENEMLPQLDLILEGSHHTGSNEDLFSTRGDKYGYAAGIRFSVPIGTDERRARYIRRRIETKQQELQVRSAIETVALELDVSANEMIVAETELGARLDDLSRARHELNTINERWIAGAGAESALTLLTELLDAQERLQRAEEAVATSEVAIAVARENLIRARGGYLAHWGIVVVPDKNLRNERKTYRLEATHK
ncbi:MAG: TolC family protein [Pseudomonadota bacterium]